MNALLYNRDLTESLEKLNETERLMTDHKSRGNAAVTLPEMRKGGIVTALGTLLARGASIPRPKDGFKRLDIDFLSPINAAAAATAQLAYYEILEQTGEIRIIRNRDDLNLHWKAVAGGDFAGLPIGIIISMEGADPIIHPSMAKYWWDRGLRVASLAHYGRGTYAAGTGATGLLTQAGIELLGEFSSLGITLDVTHLSEEAFFQALDQYSGPVLASHNNCRALVPGERQFSDSKIKRLAERSAVIGVALDAWMLDPHWVKGESKPDSLTIESVVDHIDHICELTGCTLHAAIGSDLDGCFGTEQTPGDVKSVRDLQLLPERLSARGYTDDDIDAILFDNWLGFFRKHLPE